MFAIATLLTLVNQVSGTPYVSGGDSPAGMDCSGLVSWMTNASTGRPVYGDRFHTGNIESALRARGFQYGTRTPDAKERRRPPLSAELQDHLWWFVRAKTDSTSTSGSG
jgi:NlpC/P60 family